MSDQEQQTLPAPQEDRPTTPATVTDTPHKDQSAALVPAGSKSAPPPGPRRMPWYTGALMLTHLAFSGDLKQHRQWKDKVEGVHMVETLERVRGVRTRTALRRRKVWRMVRRTSAAGASLNLAATAPWLWWIVPTYAVGHGFGWFASLAFLLPIPIAWKVARRLYEDASIESIRDAEHSGAFGGLKRWSGGTARSFAAGFGFGFTLLLLQGLISWFFTPAPSFFLELFLDTYYALIGGLLSGGVSVLLAPVIAHTGRAALEAGSTTPPARQLEA